MQPIQGEEELLPSNGFSKQRRAYSFVAAMVLYALVLGEG